MAPKSAITSSGKFAYPDDASETPDTLQTVFQYEGYNMLWEHAAGIDGDNYGRREGIAFIGNNGTEVSISPMLSTRSTIIFGGITS